MFPERPPHRRVCLNGRGVPAVLLPAGFDISVLGIVLVMPVDDGSHLRPAIRWFGVILTLRLLEYIGERVNDIDVYIFVNRVDADGDMGELRAGTLLAR